MSAALNRLNQGVLTMGKKASRQPVGLVESAHKSVMKEVLYVWLATTHIHTPSGPFKYRSPHVNKCSRFTRDYVGRIAAKTDEQSSLPEHLGRAG